MQPLWSFFLTISFSVLISGHAMAESTLRIDSETLNKQLLNKNVTIVDARSPETYQFGHIPGAVNFPEIETYEQRGVNGRIMVPSRMQELARSLGLKTDNTIIVYDDGEMTTAARVFWTLEVYGFKNVKVLDQGFGGWQAQARPTTLPPPEIIQSDYVPVINHQRIATKFTTQIASHSPNQIIIDARDLSAYQGKISSAKRFGHIPTAISIPASHNLEQNQGVSRILPGQKLKALYSNVSKQNKVIIYCSIGLVSATNYLALRELGYDVANYDASWREWGNDFSLPIKKLNSGN